MPLLFFAAVKSSRAFCNWPMAWSALPLFSKRLPSRNAEDAESACGVKVLLRFAVAIGAPSNKLTRTIKLMNLMTTSEFVCFVLLLRFSGHCDVNQIKRCHQHLLVCRRR